MRCGLTVLGCGVLVLALAMRTKFAADWLRDARAGGCANHIDLLIVAPDLGVATTHQAMTTVDTVSRRLDAFPTYHLHVSVGKLSSDARTMSTTPAVTDIVELGAQTTLPQHAPPTTSICQSEAVVTALQQLFAKTEDTNSRRKFWPSWKRTSKRAVVLFLCDTVTDSTDSARRGGSRLLDSEVNLVPQDTFDTAMVIVDRTRQVDQIGDPNCADAYQDGSHANSEQTLTCLLDQQSTKDSAQAILLKRGHDVQVHSADVDFGPAILHTVLDLQHDHCRDRMATRTEAALSRLLSCPASESRAIQRLKVEDGFVPAVIAAGKPVLLLQTPARNWSFIARHKTVGSVVSAIAQAEARDEEDSVIFPNVKLSRTGHFMDPSEDAKLNPVLPAIELEYVTQNLSAAELTEALNSKRVPHPLLGQLWPVPLASQYFTALPAALHGEFEPSRPFFWSDEDHTLRKQFLWLSSPGGRTHMHFDQDPNFFVQLVGTKRFTLYQAGDHHRLHPFPRLHPLWHKSQVSFPTPGISDERHLRCPAGQPIEVTVAPGDVLYIPPYVWHSVETLTPSVSLATLSHDNEVRNAMEMIYRHDFKSDMLVNRTGKVAALRLLLDLTVGMLYSRAPGATTRFARSVIRERFATILQQNPDLGRVTRDLVASCHFPGVPPNRVPIAQHVYQDCLADARILTSAFQSVPPEARDMLFADLVEELIAGVVGGENVPIFLNGCFGKRSLEYHLTSPSDEMHGKLWRHYDEEIDGELG
eukprot:m.227614 g.227614  ORF g.227614 m.227614 type:complete len:757 (+) comp15663_c0_seq1:210-2480(+)